MGTTESDRTGGCPVHDIHQFDMYDPAYVAAIFDVFAAMHAEGPVTRAEPYGGWWIITGHDEVFAAARDHRTFSRQTEFPTHRFTRDGQEFPPNPASAIMLRTLISLDPPAHKPVRVALNPHFTPAAIAPYEPNIRAYANELIDSFSERGSCDAWLDFAQPLAHVVIFAELLHCPVERLADLWAIIENLPPNANGHTVDDLLEAMAEFVTDFVLWRKEQPPLGDVIDTLLATEINGQRLSLDIVIANVVLILAAGVETTGSVIATALDFLGRNTELRAQLAADPALLEQACEELLRLFGSVQLQPRTVMQDTELGGQQLKRGDRVLLAYGAASRDPKLYECPEEFRLERDTKSHVAFGLGAHRCIGSNIARLEFRVALEEWLRRIPLYELGAGHVYRRKIDHIHGPVALPLTFPAGARETAAPVGVAP